MSLSRSADIPARFAIGAAIPLIGTWEEWMAIVVGKILCCRQMVAIDSSEANKYSTLATCYVGRHLANRIEFMSGRALILDPGNRSGPIKFLAYPIVEVDGKSSFAKLFSSFIRKDKS